MRSATEAEFDAKSSAYESDRLSGWYKAQGDVVLRHIEPVCGPVLDVGCGTGWLLRRIVERHSGATGVGVDLSGQMIITAEDRARTEHLDRLSFIHGDWEDTATRDQVRALLTEPASAILCVSAFHYFRDAHAAVCGMFDLLAHGGRIFLLDRAMDTSIGTFIWDMLHRRVIKDGARFYRTEELATLLERAGCRNIRVLSRINRLFWKGKLHTSLTLISGSRGRANARSARPRE